MAHGSYKVHVSTEVNAGRKLVPNRRRKVFFITFPKFISLCNQSSLPDYKSLHRIHQSLSYWIFQVKDILLWVGLELGRDSVHSAVRTGARRARGGPAGCLLSALSAGSRWGGPGLPPGRPPQLFTHTGTNSSNCLLEGRAQTLRAFSLGLRWNHYNSDHTCAYWRRGGMRQPWGGCPLDPQAPQHRRRWDHCEEKGLSFSLLLSLLRGYQTHMDWEKEKGEPFPYYVYGAACSEVEVDCLTGAHKVKSSIWVCPLHRVNTNTDVLAVPYVIINLILQVENPGTDSQLQSRTILNKSFFPLCIFSWNSSLGLTSSWMLLSA